MCHWPQALMSTTGMSEAASAITITWAIRDGITTHVGMAQQNMTLLTKAASHEEPEAPASVCLRRPKSTQRNCCTEIFFSTALVAFIPKEDVLKLCLATLFTKYYLLPDSIRF